jgi:4-carboxymuconolactone decarboxylase
MELARAASQAAAIREETMKKLTVLACLALSLALPVAAAENMRFAPITPDKFSAKQQEFAKLLTSSPRNGNVNNPPFKVYFRSPEFGVEAIRMSDYLRWGTGLDPRLVEFAILISARSWDSNYVWHAHYPAAVKGGLDPSVAADMAAGKRPTKMKADEAIVYDLLTQMYRDKNVNDAAYNAAVAKYGEKGVTDIIGIAAYYGITAMALIAAKAPVAPGDEPKLQQMAQVFPK